MSETDQLGIVLVAALVPLRRKCCTEIHQQSSLLEVVMCYLSESLCVDCTFAVDNARERRLNGHCSQQPRVPCKGPNAAKDQVRCSLKLFHVAFT